MFLYKNINLYSYINMVLKNTFISQGGYHIPYKSIKNDSLDNLKKKLVAKPFAMQGMTYGKDDDISEYNVYIENNNNIIIKSLKISYL